MRMPFRRCLIRAGGIALLSLLARPLLAQDLSIWDPAAPETQAANIKDLFILVLAVTGAIFVLVAGMLLYCVIRFRQRPDSPTTEPPQIYGSRPIEMAWTVAPVLIVFVLFLVVIRTVGEVRQENPPEGARQVVVVGHQWWWEYRYPNPAFPGADEPEFIVTANEMHVPAGEPIYLRLESVDVVHSFWVPRLGGKTDVIPNRTNRMWFNVPRFPETTYLGGCAEYCGSQHANMLIRLVTQSPDEFLYWLRDQKKDAVVPRENTLAQQGQQLFLRTSCVNCHTIRGTTAQGKFGPDLTHLMSRETIGSCMVPLDPAKVPPGIARTFLDPDPLTAWLIDPQTVKPGCLMPNMQLTRPDVDRIVAYLKTLK